MARGIHWFRNDLRLRDNTALRGLLSRVDAWLPVFVLDPSLLDPDTVGAPRVRFLLDNLERLQRDLADRGGVPLLVRKGKPEQVLPRLLDEAGATLLSFNADVTPRARQRDRAVRERAEKQGVRVIEELDHVIFGVDEIRTQEGEAYSVYTPYNKAWWKRWNDEPRLPERAPHLATPIEGFAAGEVPSAAALGFEDAEALEPDALPTGGEEAARRRLLSFLDGAAERYHEDRDRPDRDGTSRLSPYLRLGAISPRDCFEKAQEAADAESRLRKGTKKWLDELIWREFYAAHLAANPRVLQESYRREYDDMKWNDDDPGLEAWCQGRTGYPIVDAGMRQLARTGWMHNRVRMIVASFLTKDLLIHWREGERFFFRQLVDGDPASNNGGWQWAASTGTDAQPYFRIFNPVSQGKRYDPDGDYVRRYVPELAKVDDRHLHAPWEADSPPDDYPAPVVDHKQRRAEALERFQAARGDG